MKNICNIIIRTDANLLECYNAFTRSPTEKGDDNCIKFINIENDYPFSRYDVFKEDKDVVRKSTNGEEIDSSPIDFRSLNNKNWDSRKYIKLSLYSIFG